MRDDLRGKKVALISHCALNQNAVVGGLARFPAMIPDVVEALGEHGFAIVQLPCPEMYAAGIDRWGQVKEQYQNSGFKRSYRKVVKFTLDGIEDFVTHGYRIIVIGIGGSPSCGVKHTESNPRWGGVFEEKMERDYVLVSGRGAFIEILFEEIHSRGWEDFPAFELPDDMGKSPDAIKQLEQFLKTFD